jgi:glycine hydroxymethyltransferase
MYTALTDPGDLIMCLSIPCGGHISSGKKKFGGTAGAVHGLEIEYFQFDEKSMNIDVDASIKKIRELKPKLLLFGGSVFLFPHPIKEFTDVAKEIANLTKYQILAQSGVASLAQANQNAQLVLALIKQG